MLTTLLPVLEVAAVQAGGGGAFGGGGGGGGGDDGIFWILYWLLRLAIEYPALGVPLLIGALILSVMGTRRGWWKHQERTIWRTRPLRRARASTAVAQVLRESDPGFDAGRFLVRVRAAFQKAQAAWCAQDLEPLRPFVTDGVFERFSLQIAEQELDGWRQGMEHTQVHPPTLAHAESGRHFETVTVRIPFESDIHRLDLATGKRIAGSQLPRTDFVELWSFVRRRGVGTIAGKGLMEGKCPECGGTIEMNQSARCSYCKCLARSGRFDWVLAEITQEAAWRAEHEQDVPGFAAFAERDPGMNLQMLEDRASVAFWRMTAADREADFAPLSRLAAPELAERYAERFSVGPDGTRTYAAERAVGSVRTLGLLAGDPQDRVVVEVIWDGVRATVRPGGERKLDRERHLRHTLFVFVRAAGETTRLDEAFTTAHCRNCGAPDPGGIDPLCPYCDTPRTGDRSTWLLAEVLNPLDAQPLLAEIHAMRKAARRPERAGPPVEPAPRPAPSPAGLFGWAVKLVRADGFVDGKERAALHRLGARIDLSPDQVDEVLETRLEGPGDLLEPLDDREAYEWLAQLIELALADGTLSRREKTFLAHAAESLGLGRSELERVIRWTRKDLYRRSRAAKRET